MKPVDFCALVKALTGQSWRLFASLQGSFTCSVLGVKREPPHFNLQVCCVPPIAPALLLPSAFPLRALLVLWNLSFLLRAVGEHERGELTGMVCGKRGSKWKPQVQVFNSLSKEHTRLTPLFDRAKKLANRPILLVTCAGIAFSPLGWREAFLASLGSPFSLPVCSPLLPPDFALTWIHTEVSGYNESSTGIYICPSLRMLCH